MFTIVLSEFQIGGILSLSKKKKSQAALKVHSQYRMNGRLYRLNCTFHVVDFFFTGSCDNVFELL